MTTCMEPNGQIWISRSVINPKRKLKWTWENIEINGSNVLINTQRANAIVESALKQQLILSCRAMAPFFRKKNTCDGVRVDFKLGRRLGCTTLLGRSKNTTLLVSEGITAFPDSVTTRGVKQLNALSSAALNGDNVAIIYLIGRTNCDRVRTS